MALNLKKRWFTIHCRIIGLLLLTTHCLAQSTTAFTTYRQQSLTEKLYLHTDQSFYLTGETLWFKAYYVDGTFHKSLDLSKVAYVELMDREGRSVLQTKVALSGQGGSGTLFLPASLNAGNYWLRAYTNWMKNFPADYFFQKAITVVNPFKPLGLPLLPKKPDYEVGLFPEGGQLVQGLPGRVAFRVADASGRGGAVRGWLLNAQNDTLTRFTSERFGMGAFELTPAEGVAYRVLFQDGQNHSFTHELPAVQARGYTLRLDESSPDQLRVTVTTNADAGGPVFLLAHTRQDVRVAEQKPLTPGQPTTFLLDRNKLGEGISHLTVFDANGKPVAERLYFRQPRQVLPIVVTPAQPVYGSRTTVRVGVKTATNEVNLSMAVYRLDSLSQHDSGNILSYLWLSSDLSGSVESPAFYFQPDNADVRKAADNLMMTQGWRRFRWDEVLKPQPAALSKAERWPRPFLPEANGLMVSGTVTDPATGKPAPNILTYLSAPGKPIRLYTSRSDANGNIRFELPDYFGDRDLLLQTAPEDSLYKLTLANPFNEVNPTSRLPQFSINESQGNDLLDRSVAMQVQSTYLGNRVVSYRNPAVDSSAFYGKPSETYLLDAFTRFPRMEEVLREYVPGVLPRKRQGRFQLLVPNSPYNALFDTPSLVLVDGVPVFDMDQVIGFSPLKVRQLDVVTNHYFMGEARFTGIISFMTYKGDLASYPLEPRVLKVDYEGLQLQREFYTPRYGANAQSRVPDARTLLYWNPDLKPNTQGEVTVEFPTSDQTGQFVIEVQGLSTSGQAGVARGQFEVRGGVK